MNRSEAVYRRLLAVLPRAFRKLHGEEMLEWFREHHASTEQRGGGRAWIGFWRLILQDLARTTVIEHGRALARYRRSTDGEGMMGGLLEDTRLAVRSFRRRPAFAALVLGTLALGVGSATAGYSVVHDIVLAPLPYAQPNRIVRVGKVSSGRPGILSVSALDLRDLQGRNHSFDALAASRPANMTLSGEGEPELVRAAIVSSTFFQTLGRQPALGRGWTPSNDDVDGTPVAVLSHGLWQRHWGDAPDVLGRTITLSGKTFTVIGVMPAGFVPPEALNQSGTDVWVPLALLDPEARAQRRNGFLQVVGRLRTDVTRESAADELTALGTQLSGDYPDAGDRTFGLSPLQRETVGDVGDALFPILAAVGLLLLVACINVANLLVIRANERSAELALRKCIGANRTRLIRQLMTEGLILGIGGGVLGAPVAAAAVKAFATYGPRQLPRLSEVAVDGRVLLVSLVLSLATSVLFSLLPAFTGSGTKLNEELAGAGRGGSASRGNVRIRELLVSAQTALAIVLTISGGLLLNTLVRLNHVDLGFRPEGVGAVSVLHPAADDDQIRDFFDGVVARVAAIPGTRNAGATSTLPLAGHDQVRMTAPGLSMDDDDRERGGLPVTYEVVTPGYFDAMGIEGRRGRLFGAGDDETAPPVAVVNESLARRLRQGADPVGLRITLSDDPEGQHPIEVVGVVADTRQERIDATAAEEIYFPFRQRPIRLMDVVARSAGAGATLLPAMRREVWAVRSDLPVRRSLDMTAWVARSLADRRFFALLMGAFAALALCLTGVGVYGTLAYAVAQRRRELGIRMAVGATGGSVMATVFRRSAVMLGLGTTVGTGAALATTRLIASQLFGVTATDPVTVTLGVLVVLGAGLVATVVPALRAARVDPVVSLRTG